MLDLFNRFAIILIKILVTIISIFIITFVVIVIKDIVVSLDCMMTIIEKLDERILEIYYD